MGMVRNMVSRRGFSMLEMAVVLTIIAMIAGAGMGMATNALKTADRIATQEKLNTIKLAIDSHAKTYGYLPCPADYTDLMSETTFGVERRATPGTLCNTGDGCVVGITSGGVANAVWAGAIPVRTLGLPDSYASDSWNGKMYYAVSANMAANAESYAINQPYITIRYGNLSTYYSVTQKRNVLSFNSSASGTGSRVNLGFAAPHGISSTSLILNVKTATVGASTYNASFPIHSIPDTTHITLQNSSDAGVSASGTIEWTQDGTSAAYVLWSGGADGRGVTPIDSTNNLPSRRCEGIGANTSPKPCTSASVLTCIDIENCDNTDDIWYDTAFNDTTDVTYAAQHFDDFIVWGSNAGQRNAVNDTLYTACPTTTPATCETWCAACSINFPGASATTPPAGLTNPVLCKKVINSNATTCTASCFWSGTTASGFVKCP